jgi:hypothetical protein
VFEFATLVAPGSALVAEKVVALAPSGFGVPLVPFAADRAASAEGAAEVPAEVPMDASIEVSIDDVSASGRESFFRRAPLAPAPSTAESLPEAASNV